MLSAGMRLVACASIALGTINSILLLMALLMRTLEESAQGVHLTYVMIISQIGMVIVGVGLFRLYRSAWIAFWFVGLGALSLAAEQARWLDAQRDHIESIPFFIGIDLALWFVASGICMLLPSSRKFYFNEPDQIWMHKKVFRKQEEAATSVSGRPRKPVGVTILACVAIFFAALVFVFAMSQLAEPETESVDAPPRLPTGWVATLIGFSIATIAASSGLFRTRLWAWYGTLACAIIAILLAALLLSRQMREGMPASGVLRTPTFLLCVLWCGSGAFYLLLPKVRRPFFSRSRRRR